MSVYIGDSKALFGLMVAELPLHLAPYVLRYKIRVRQDQLARIFLKVANPDDPLMTRWEEWYLGCDGETLFPWIQKAENISRQTSYAIIKKTDSTSKPSRTD